MPGASDIRAGRADVELRAPVGPLDKDLAAGEQRIARYAQNVRAIDKALRSADSPQAKEGLQRTRAGMAERLGTAQQETEGRRGLAQRLAAFKASRAAERAAAQEQAQAAAQAAAQAQVAARQKQVDGAKRSAANRDAQWKAVQSEQGAGRKALAQRLAVYKASRQVEKETSDQQEADRRKTLAGEHRSIKESWRAQQKALADKERALSQEMDLAQRRVDDRKAVEMALWNATATARDKALRDNDTYWAQIRKKAGNNKDILGRIDKQQAADRKKILEQAPEQLIGDKRAQGLVKALIGEEGLSKINAIAGGFGLAAAAAVGLKLGAMGAEASIDAMVSSTYAAAGQADKCAEISQKWVDKLSSLPVIGQLFAVALDGISAKNQQILADFEKMRQSSEKIWSNRPQAILRLKTTLASPMEGRQEQINSEYSVRSKEAAKAKREAEKAKQDAEAEFANQKVKRTAAQLARSASGGMIPQYLIDKYFPDPGKQANTAEQNANIVAAEEELQRLKDQKAADEEQLRRDRETLHGNQAFDTRRAGLAATSYGRPWAGDAKRRAEEMLLQQEQERFGVRYNNDVDKAELDRKQNNERLALARELQDQVTDDEEQARQRRMTGADRETSQLRQQYDKRRADLQELIDLENDPGQRTILQARLSDMAREQAAEEALIAAEGRRAQAREALQRMSYIQESAMRAGAMEDNTRRFEIKGSFGRAQRQATEQADLFRAQQSQQIEDLYAFKPEDTLVAQREKILQKQQAMANMEKEASLMEQQGSEPFREQVHGWLESIKKPAERIADFKDRLDEAQQANVLTPENRAKLEKRMGGILGLDTSTTGTFSSQLYGMAAKDKVAEIATATQETARNTRRFANGTLRLG